MQNIKISNLLILCLLCPGAIATPTFLFVYCPNTTTSSSNTPFKSNLHNLLSTLSASATNGFSNSTSGTAHGLFLCRGDVSAAVCRDCVATAARVATKRCTKSKMATIWYDECMLRYSDRPIFSVSDQSVRKILYNTQRVNKPDQFRDLLGKVLNDVVKRASKGYSGKKFATREANFSALQELYALAQCTPDIATSDCDVCLRDAVASFPSCCDGSRGGRVLFPSCNVRFELYPFYNVTAAAAIAPPLSKGSPAPEGKKRNSFLILEITILLVVVASTFIIGCWTCRKIQQKYVKEKRSKRLQDSYLLSETESLSTYEEVCRERDEMGKEMVRLQVQLTDCKDRIAELEERFSDIEFKAQIAG